MQRPSSEGVDSNVVVAQGTEEAEPCSQTQMGTLLKQKQENIEKRSRDGQKHTIRKKKEPEERIKHLKLQICFITFIKREKKETE